MNFLKFVYIRKFIYIFFIFLSFDYTALMEKIANQVHATNG